MRNEVVVVADGPSGAWRIRAAGKGGALLFGGAAFQTRKDAAAFLEAANRKVGAKKWTVKRRKGTDERQLTLFELF